MSHDGYTKIATGMFPGAEVVHAVRLTGGVSADVHRLDLKLTNGSTTSLVLRAHGESHSGHPAELEFQLLQALHKSRIPTPEPLLVDVSCSLLDDPFLVMEFVEGTSAIPYSQQDHYIDVMAETLAAVHTLPTSDLPILPLRNNPLSEVFDYLPAGLQWQDLLEHLRTLTDTEYSGSPKLLHGDFWPENLLWREGRIACVLDWEDAALGDPLSDVAGCCLELRYKFGSEGMQRFTQAYAKHRTLDQDRLALWQVYVASAAQRFMGKWGLEPALEAHMRTTALTSIREAGAVLRL